ncbi:YeiH family protein [Catenovulum sp. 2E275]|uniref:YeiH family protein n=1 Tax=Catenovulum sp. 2E275 TaxID=2980497 RepID=UPI0021CED217|nr:YeiH family protein [Catenovulum sp. 2E275]MCU4674660.1 YeiH family protein [Catenovulum sp. 2E275]
MKDNADKITNLIKGSALCILSALFCLILIEYTVLKTYSVSVLSLAIFLGFCCGNLFKFGQKHLSSGIEFVKTRFLRAGIILYGVKVSLISLTQVGLSGVVIAATMLLSTFTLAYILGTRYFKLDQQTTILIGAGSSICGAAAILATNPVVKAQSHKVSVAVSTVVVFGSLAMLLYPALYPYLNLDEYQYGIFVGATIHEVAQVVATGDLAGAQVSDIAVIEKMIRVIMLAPFLVFISYLKLKQTGEAVAFKNIQIPWFAVMFILVIVLNSSMTLPDTIKQNLILLDDILLTSAMFALGLTTQVSAIKQAGVKPLILAGYLFLFLLSGGYLINLACFSILF